MAKEKYLECGKIINTHGIRGGVKAESFCDTPKKLASLTRLYFRDGNVFREHKIKKASVFRQFVLFEIEGIDNVDSASAEKGRIIYADRDDLAIDDGSYFIADIIGLRVIDINSGRVYGTLAEVSNLGASDIYTVNTDDGEKMIPAVPEFIKKIDLEKGIFVSVIEGMFD